ncbi:nuclear transport factor 2 family protein [Streptomyces spinoverrucosus]|uniref:nuclear transport factor 2 family protein n=1 Tax=Streptomyces spinoverrucosus TaxID=284043 RepID=UPI0018C448DE|nr:nuclear transport factor 2 family protein [Streptomyces spinoverrucosus]MBG0855800.1 nuclear transport factor 2 family protein [Streptomyces spinoverrucosus]
MDTTSERERSYGQAQFEIRNVLARIAHSSDEGTLEEYGACFTEDARWEMPGQVVRKGRTEICLAGAERRASAIAGPGTRTRHLISTTAVTVHGDEAVAESCWQFYVGTGGRPVLASMGTYRDTFRRTDEGWQVTERIVRPG